MNLRRRWSGPGETPEARVVPFEALSSPSPHDESNHAPNHQPGPSADRSLEPLPVSRWPDERAETPEPVPPPAAQPFIAGSQTGREASGPREWCSIVLAVAQRQGEFQVVMLDGAGQRQVVARSPSFRIPRSGRVNPRGSAREAHSLLVKGLLGAGWSPVASRGRWHDMAFTRTADSGERRVERILLSARLGRLTSRFQAAHVDELGNATIVAESAPFRALHARGSTQLSRGAAKAHDALLKQLQAEGWQLTESTGLESSYGTVLERPARLRPLA